MSAFVSVTVGGAVSCLSDGRVSAGGGVLPTSAGGVVSVGVLAGGVSVVTGSFSTGVVSVFVSSFGAAQAASINNSIVANIHIFFIYIPPSVMVLVAQLIVRLVLHTSLISCWRQT